MNYADAPFDQRLTLAADWNRLVRAGRRVTVHQFAARHGHRSETWRRRYAEYDSSVAQDAINGGNANKGARMRVTNQMARLFRKHALEERRTPYHPKQRPKGPKPHPAMTIPRRLTLDDRPAGATH